MNYSHKHKFVWVAPFKVASRATADFFRTYSDLNPHLQKEITHFFKVYKDLEKKKVDIGKWGNAAEARDILKQSIERYQNSEHKKRGDFRI